VTLPLKKPEDRSTPSDIYARSIPWNDDELIRVNGMKLVYTRVGADALVHFHGGASELVSTLRRRGYDVEAPKVWRTSNRF